MSTFDSLINILYTSSSFIIVAAIWGCTNPFLRSGSEMTKPIVPSGNVVIDSIKSVINTLLNWRFVIPFAINQSGSLIYFYLLGNTDISMAVPICNSLTFIFTALTAVLIGEKNAKLTLRTLIGTVLILTGVAICVLAKDEAAK